MEKVNLYCKAREGYRIRVGTLIKNKMGRIFIKHKPQLMRVVGENGGFRVQRYVYDDSHRLIDMQKLFRNYPQMIIFIPAGKTRSQGYISGGKHWLAHLHHGNYGDGDQLFLGIDYMTPASMKNNYEFFCVNNDGRIKNGRSSFCAQCQYKKLLTRAKKNNMKYYGTKKTKNLKKKLRKE